jgi:1-deoxy-D-xylulose 5-phosphate reductoisomerase
MTPTRLTVLYFPPAAVRVTSHTLDAGRWTLEAAGVVIGDDAADELALMCAATLVMAGRAGEPRLRAALDQLQAAVKGCTDAD